MLEKHDSWMCWRCRITRMCFYAGIGLFALDRLVHAVFGP